MMLVLLGSTEGKVNHTERYQEKRQAWHKVDAPQKLCATNGPCFLKYFGADNQSYYSFDAVSPPMLKAGWVTDQNYPMLNSVNYW